MLFMVQRDDLALGIRLSPTRKSTNIEDSIL